MSAVLVRKTFFSLRKLTPEVLRDIIIMLQECLDVIGKGKEPKLEAAFFTTVEECADLADRLRLATSLEEKQSLLSAFIEDLNPRLS